MRAEIRTKTLVEYWKDNWSTAYNRFWVNIYGKGQSRCDLYYFIHAVEGLPDIIIDDLIGFDFAELFAKLLTDHGFPARP